MAERRMFSKRLINSARFIKMPASTQCLYFHLGIYADDDGVVEAYNVMNQVGATDDDLRILAAKGFVIVLNDDLVTYITDWTENNKIRADRKIDSIYKDLLLQVVPEVELLEKKDRADVKKTTGRPVDVQWTTNGQPMDGIGKDRLGKVSIGKDSIDNTPPISPSQGERVKKSKRFTPPTVEDVKAYCEERKNDIDPEAFVDFYQSKGWIVGKSKMKDWKAAVRTWERNRGVKRRSPEKPEIPEDLREAFDMC